MSLKSVLKFLGYATAAVATLIVLASVVVYAGSNRKLHRQISVAVAPVAVPTTAEAVETGRHIVATRACSDCHGTDFGGHTVIDNPAIGIFNAPNLTRGAGGLPTSYSDLDYVRAIRHGLAQDGRPLVLMPSAEYASLSDEDLGAVMAYLKSLPPVARPRGPIAPGPVIRAMLTLGKIQLAADLIDHTARRPATVTATISPEYGKYLAASCTGCHGSNFSGGKIAGAPPDWPAAANLTPHPTTRVAQWSEEQFIQTLRTQQRPDGSKLNPVMPAAFAQLTDVEVKALWSYLQTLPPAETGMH